MHFWFSSGSSLHVAKKSFFGGRPLPDDGLPGFSSAFFIASRALYACSQGVPPSAAAPPATAAPSALPRAAFAPASEISADLVVGDALWAAFSDVKITPDKSWAARDWVASPGTISGTNDGDKKERKVKKTGKTMNLHYLELMRFDAGKLAEVQRFYSGMAFMQQLGLMPGPGGA